MSTATETNQQILQKAIQKAIAGGFRYLGKPDDNGWGVGVGQWHTTETALCINRGKGGDDYIHYGSFIYRHDFAKALWGEEQVIFTQRDFREGKTLGDNALPQYQYHLQQMVIAEDPIKYLGQSI